MAMSDARILAAREEGRIVIEPFRREQLSTSSYDVCIGDQFYREQKPRFAAGIYNIYDPEHVKAVWGPVCRAEPASVALAGVPNLGGFEPDDQIVLLEPGETILAHTQEFIGGRHSITTMMKARSSIGRCFMEVCKCAGWGDVGYINRWTMEITNNSKSWNIPLLVGERVAQIVFLETGPIAGADYGETGHYQGSSADIEAVKAAWKPSNMLPNLKRRVHKGQTTGLTTMIKPAERVS